MMIDILMSYGANINFCSKYHGSVLHVIARQHACVQRKRLAEFFLKKGVSLKLVTGRKYTSLHVAVQEFMDQQKDDGFMDLLLESGADVSAETFHGNNSLHVAMQVSHSDLSHNHAKFKQVLEKCLNHSDFNINAQNKHGATILHMALRRDDFECTARILHDSDADMTIKDSSGVPPIFLLCSALKYHAPNLLVNRSRLNWFISFATHIMKLMSIRPSIRESLQEYSSILVKLSPRKFADLEISINNEVNLLKAKKIDNYTSLYDILLKSPHDVAKHSKNKDFSELISSIEFKTDFPVFSSDLIRQFKKGSTRASILDAAKPALDFVTNTKWPQCCAENILKYLRNVHLENLSKCNCIFYSTQSKSVSAANESSNKRAKLS
ncbi:hypothetical protein QAD02_006016 [Eretmocerus hayati]|uniref:Uncharacterized protein n=1 Tax=Eretmocerus hayati TaxID=131215 RepID=A0ACC2N228_9HYME|nr:hypothetical protein QAD02_006016 [Eretmocerus hayati]